MPPTPIPLPLRNALAGLALRALEDDEARAAVTWLAQPAAGRPAPTDGVRAVLVAAGLADPPGTSLLDMYEPHREHVRRHAQRCLEAVAITATLPAPTDPVDASLLGAVALWRVGLLFEVHEILEPQWARASGGVKEALQGLIQTAVAFHHLAHGNRRGARNLLRDGRAKLAATGARLGRIDVASLLAATAPWLDALGTGADPPDTAPPALALR